LMRPFAVRPGAAEDSEEINDGPARLAPSAAWTNRRREMDVFRVMQHSFRGLQSSQRNRRCAGGRDFVFGLAGSGAS